MFKSVNEGRLPEAQSKYSAGYDVFANEDVRIYPGEVRTISLGFKLDLSKKELEEIEHYFFGLYLRESFCSEKSKRALLLNGVGIISIDSTKEITLKLFNPLTDPSSYENKKVEVKKGDRIAQIVLQKNHGKLILGNEFRKE